MKRPSLTRPLLSLKPNLSIKANTPHSWSHKSLDYGDKGGYSYESQRVVALAACERYFADLRLTSNINQEPPIQEEEDDNYGNHMQGEATMSSEDDLQPNRLQSSIVPIT